LPGGDKPADAQSSITVRADGSISVGEVKQLAREYRDLTGRPLGVTGELAELVDRPRSDLSHEGPELLRWALFEAAQQACRPASPDHDYYRQVARRIEHNRVCLSVARKLCRRAYHILGEFGDEALAPIDAPTDEEVIAAAA
jgi:hypothetical protein